eukprot:128030_1
MVDEADWDLLEQGKLAAPWINHLCGNIPAEHGTISTNVWFALNYGKFADCTHLFGVFKSKPKHKRLHLRWIIPSKNEIKLPFATVQGRTPTPMEYSYGYVFGYIAHAVFPYWCYHVHNYGPGTLVIEIQDLKPMESVININTFHIQPNASNVRITYLNKTQLEIFLHTMDFIHGMNGAVKYTQNMNQALTAYKQRKNKKGVGMSVFYLLRKTTFTMSGWESKHNKSYDKERMIFELAMKQANMKRCQTLILDLKTKCISVVNVRVKYCAWTPCKEGKKELKVCTGCKVARYCCRSHQKRHWKKFHRYCCKR